ncbi:MAG: DUF5711 family protein [Lachnospiraceae bacterium]
MADIRNYTGEKSKNEQEKRMRQSKLRLVKSEDEGTFQDKLRRHRLTFFYRILLAVLVCAALIALVVVQYRSKIYEDYDVISTSALEPVNGTTDIRLGNSFLTYSKDGAHCTDAEGNVLWNQTYEMQSPIVAVCGDVAAIGDYNGRTIYVQNSEKQLGTISTNLPIRNLCVAANGVVAAVLDDTKVTWIYVYDSAGNELLNFRTTMKNTGYPVSVSLSPNALLFAVSYVYMDAGAMKSSVAFYNFDEYGQNQIDNLVRGDDCHDTVVPYVQFMSNTNMFAVGDDCLMFYGGSQVPDLLSVYYFETEIRGVYYNEDYVGLVFYNDTGSDRYRLEIYNKSGERVRTQDFNLDYTDILFDKDTFIIYNEEECMIMTMDGTSKYAGNFKKAVRLLVPTNGRYRYTLVAQDSLDIIQMK